jgi:hypothetical protein
VGAGLGSTWWQYLLLFGAVAASWAGVPIIGTAALGTAAVAASQDKLDLAAVIVVAVLAGEAGGSEPSISCSSLRLPHPAREDDGAPAGWADLRYRSVEPRGLT